MHPLKCKPLCDINWLAFFLYFMQISLLRVKITICPINKTRNSQIESSLLLEAKKKQCRIYFICFHFVGRLQPWLTEQKFHEMNMLRYIYNMLKRVVKVIPCAAVENDSEMGSRTVNRCNKYHYSSLHIVYTFAQEF